jgi:hypothetical protein
LICSLLTCSSVEVSPTTGDPWWSPVVGLTICISLYLFYVLNSRVSPGNLIQSTMEVLKALLIKAESYNNEHVLPLSGPRVIKSGANALLYTDEIRPYRMSFWYRGAVSAVYQEKVVA